MSIKTSGSLSSDDNLGSNPDLIKFFGSGFALGGPIIVHDSAVDPSRPDTIGYVVEIKGAVSSTPPGFTAANYSLRQTINVTLTYTFSSGTPYVVSTGVQPDGPDIVQNSPGQNLYEIDAPGAGSAYSFSLFGPNPPTVPTQPPGTTITSFKIRCDLVTQAINSSNGSVCGTLKWFTQYIVTGASLSNVVATAGSE